MAHHGNELNGFDFKNFRPDDLFKKSMLTDEQYARLDHIMKRSEAPNLGATGKFPEGKLNEGDNGEIKLGITNAENRVILSFGETPVKWIGFTKEQAREIADSLLKHADSI